MPGHCVYLCVVENLGFIRLLCRKYDLDARGDRVSKPAIEGSNIENAGIFVARFYEDVLEGSVPRKIESECFYDFKRHLFGFLLLFGFRSSLLLRSRRLDLCFCSLSNLRE